MLDLRPLEGLTLDQLINRFPAVPTTVPGASGSGATGAGAGSSNNSASNSSSGATGAGNNTSPEGTRSVYSTHLY